MMKETDAAGFIALLKEEIVSKFGRPINTSRDCLMLSQDIYERISEPISANTLRRLFGLVHTEFQPSGNTLNILCHYCGYMSIEELIAHRRRRDNNGDEDPDGEAMLHYLVSLFREVPTGSYDNQTFIHLVKSTHIFLQQYPNLRSYFQQAIAKTKNGQDYYFEQFIASDSLNGFYGDGLRYYLLEKRNSAAQVFGYGLLCLKAWLIEHDEELLRYYNRLQQHPISADMHPFIVARHFSARLFHAVSAGADVQQVLSEAAAFHSTIEPSNEHYRQFPGFEYLFSQALLFAGFPDEALRYIQHGNTYYTSRPVPFDEGYDQALLLIEACCLALCGNTQGAADLYPAIKPAKFYMLRQKMDGILYLQLEKHLNKSSSDQEQRLHQLIAETGFTRLLKLKGKGAHAERG